jgi:hypothetical protein
MSNKRPRSEKPRSERRRTQRADVRDQCQAALGRCISKFATFAAEEAKKAIKVLKGYTNKRIMPGDMEIRSLAKQTVASTVDRLHEHCPFVSSGLGGSSVALVSTLDITDRVSGGDVGESGLKSEVDTLLKLVSEFRLVLDINTDVDWWSYEAIGRSPTGKHTPFNVSNVTIYDMSELLENGNALMDKFLENEFVPVHVRIQRLQAVSRIFHRIEDNTGEWKNFANRATASWKTAKELLMSTNHNKLKRNASLFPWLHIMEILEYARQYAIMSRVSQSARQDMLGVVIFAFHAAMPPRRKEWRDLVYSANRCDIDETEYGNIMWQDQESGDLCVSLSDYKTAAAYGDYETRIPRESILGKILHIFIAEQGLCAGPRYLMSRVGGDCLSRGMYASLLEGAYKTLHTKYFGLGPSVAPSCNDYRHSFVTFTREVPYNIAGVRMSSTAKRYIATQMGHSMKTADDMYDVITDANGLPLTQNDPNSGSIKSVSCLYNFWGLPVPPM